MDDKEKKEYMKKYYAKHKDEFKKYREEHKDEIAKYNKQYYEENKDELKKYREEHKDEFKKYREEHKDEIAKKIKQYREENKDKIAKQQKQYNEEHKDEIAKYKKQYREEHKDKLNRKVKKNDISRLVANNHRELWSAKDEYFLMLCPFKILDKDIAKYLGRTIRGVQRKRGRLKDYFLSVSEISSVKELYYTTNGNSKEFLKQLDLFVSSTTHNMSDIEIRKNIRMRIK